MAERSRARNHGEDTPLLEWILGALGALILTAALVFLLVQGSAEERFGDVQVQIERITPVDDGYVVYFSAWNRGTQTLADLQLTARITDERQEIERAELRFDYLPGRSRRHGGVYLEHDPRVHRLEIRPQGFQEP